MLEVKRGREGLSMAKMVEGGQAEVAEDGEGSTRVWMTMFFNRDQPLFF